MGRLSPTYLGLLLIFVGILFLYYIWGIIPIIIGIAIIYKAYQDRKESREKRPEGKYACPYCGTRYPSLPGFCLKCGKKIKHEDIIKNSRLNIQMICPVCNILLEKGAEHCPHCGRKV